MSLKEATNGSLDLRSIIANDQVHNKTAADAIEHSAIIERQNTANDH